MPLRVKCSACQATLQVPDSLRGKQVRCSNCQSTMAIPAIQAAPSPSATQPQKSPNPSPQHGAGSLRIQCPGCQTLLQVQSSMAGKVVRCTKCQSQMQVPNAAPAPAPKPAPSNEDIFASLPSSSTPGPLSSPPPSPARSPARAAPRPVANPYVKQNRSPQYLNQRSAATLPSGRATWLYLVPAIFMIIWACLVVAVAVFQIGLTIFLLATGKVNFQQIDMAYFAGQMAGKFLALALQVAVINGSVAMMQRSRLGAARAAAVISAIPCFGCLVFPIGIWACVLLYSDRAERDFR